LRDNGSWVIGLCGPTSTAHGDRRSGFGDVGVLSSVGLSGRPRSTAYGDRRSTEEGGRIGYIVLEPFDKGEPGGEAGGKISLRLNGQSMGIK